jgi:hypothetical protein
MPEKWINPEHAELVEKYEAAQREAEERGEDSRLRWFLPQLAK